MKVALLHSYFDEIGGAELVILSLARAYNAPIYTTNIDRQKINKLGYGDVTINSIGSVPTLPHLKQIFAQLHFSRLKLTGFYYYIIGGVYALPAAKKHKPCLWYCFSPERGLYEHPESLVLKPIKTIQRFFDKKWVGDVSCFLSISNRVAGRVKSIYGKSSKVIYPPVDVSSYSHFESENFWLSVNRLIPHKNVEVQIEAFAKLPDKKLIIVGSPESEDYFQKLKKMATGNVQFRKWVDDQELKKLYATCNGLISTSLEEDFGLVAIEAMASGKPVVAPVKSGFSETVVDGSTGILLEEMTSIALADAVQKLDDSGVDYATVCMQRAAQFDKKHFIESFNDVLRK